MLWLVLPVLLLAAALVVLWSRLQRRQAAALADGRDALARLRTRLDRHRQRLAAYYAAPDDEPGGDGALPPLPTVPKPERRSVRRRSGPREPRSSSGS